MDTELCQNGNYVRVITYIYNKGIQPIWTNLRTCRTVLTDEFHFVSAKL